MSCRSVSLESSGESLAQDECDCVVIQQVSNPRLTQAQLDIIIAAVISQLSVQIYQDHTGSPPDDPTLPALSYPTGGGTLSQWDVDSQTWV